MLTALKCVSAAAPVTVVVTVAVSLGLLATPPVAVHAMLVLSWRAHAIVAALLGSVQDSLWKWEVRYVPFTGDAHGELSSLRSLDQSVWLGEVAGVGVGAGRTGDEIRCRSASGLEDSS